MKAILLFILTVFEAGLETFDAATTAAIEEIRSQLSSAIFFFIAGFVCAAYALYQIGRDERHEEIRSFVAGVVSPQLLSIFLLICLFFFAMAFSIRLIEHVPADRTSDSELVSTRILRVGLGGMSAFILPAIGFFLGLAAFQAVMLIDAFKQSCSSERIHSGLLSSIVAAVVLIAAYGTLVFLRSIRFSRRIVSFSCLVFVGYLFSLSVLDLIGDLPSSPHVRTEVRDAVPRVSSITRCQKYQLWRL